MDVTHVELAGHHDVEVLISYLIGFRGVNFAVSHSTAGAAR
jgi:hypothetical protein